MSISASSRALSRFAASAIFSVGAEVSNRLRLISRYDARKGWAPPEATSSMICCESLATNSVPLLNPASRILRTTTDRLRSHRRTWV